MNPIIDKDGTQNGVRHRTDELHRTDGPAIEYADGPKFWFQNGFLHRTDGPAIEWLNGDKSWYQNGVRHRTDGPAIESAKGSKSWYLNGMKLSEDMFLKLTGPVKKLPLYMGLGFDQFISERIKNESGY